MDPSPDDLSSSRGFVCAESLGGHGSTDRPDFFSPDWVEARLVTLYREFENRCRQSLWESTHSIYIPKEKRDLDPDLDRFWHERKQRRSRSGPRWKTILRFILRGMIDGHCDLDILLDPFFMHFPGYLEVPPWFPGFGCSQKNLPNLATALAMLDTAEP